MKENLTAPQLKGDLAVIKSGFPPVFIQVLTEICMTAGVSVRCGWVILPVLALAMILNRWV